MCCCALYILLSRLGLDNNPEFLYHGYMCVLYSSNMDTCDVTAQNQALVAICHLPQFQLVNL